MKQGNKCPFSQTKCSENCVLFRKGFRYYDTEGKEPVLVEMCAINLIADCLENQITRTFALQKEMNLIRNSTDRAGDIFQVILDRAEQINRNKQIEE